MLNIFDHPEDHQYFYDNVGNLWMHGIILGERLGYKNPREAIVMHTKENERQQFDNGGTYLNLPYFVSESGMWRLVLKSRNKTCEQFREKLCTEILPAIRKNGGYISDTASLDQVTTLLNQAEIRVAEMTEELALSALKVTQMAEFIQGESDRTRKAKESVTDEAIKEAVVDFVCETDDTHGDPLVLQTYLKNENRDIKLDNHTYKKLLTSVYSQVWDNKTIVGKYIKAELLPYKNKFTVTA